jgi:tetratricopeptide (TPR) repeat protein
MKPSWIETDEERLHTLRPLVEGGRASVEEIIEYARIVQRLRLGQEKPPTGEEPAGKILAEGLRRFPDEPRLLRELAAHLRMRGDNSGSRRLLRKALRLCKERGEFDSVDSIAKELADDFFCDGCDALDAGDHIEAEGRFRRALRLYPLHADAWGHLGIIHESRGNWLEAGRCYWRGLQLGRIACHETELHDRWIAKVTRSPKEARTHYWGQLSTRPYLRAIYNWAQLLYQRKDLRGALVYAEESLLANANDNTGARYLVYSILRVLGKKSEMGKLARQYPGESLSHEADQLEIRCFGSPINKQQRRGKPN